MNENGGSSGATTYQLKSTKKTERSVLTVALRKVVQD